MNLDKVLIFLILAAFFDVFKTDTSSSISTATSPKRIIKFYNFI